MARLGDVPRVLRTVGPWGFARRVIGEVIDDDVLTIAAAVAFYWLFALFPFLIFLLTLTPALPASMRHEANQQIQDIVRSNLDERAAEPILRRVEDLINRPRGGLLSIGLLLTLWAASNGMNQTMLALDRCYDVDKRRNIVVQRVASMGMTVAFVLSTLLIILLIPVGNLVMAALTSDVEASRAATQSATQAALVDQLTAWLDSGWRNLLDVTRYTIGIVLIVLVVSAIYQFGPARRGRWTLITPGAVFTVFTVLAVAFAFNKYIRFFGGQSYDQTYGAIGGVIILLLLFYLYAAVFLVGAEINSEIDYAISRTNPCPGEASDPLPQLHDDGKPGSRTGRQ